MLVEALKKNNLLDSTTGPVGLDKGLDYEGKLDVLSHFADKIMADTGRFQLSDKNGMVMDEKISVDDIAQGARIWFSGPNGKKDYQKFLKDRFNIDPFPKLSELGGEWKEAIMKITDVIVPESLKNQPKSKSDELGCDFSMDLNQIKGKEMPVAISFSPQGENGGTMNFGSEKDAKSMPFTYADGTINATFSEKGAEATISFSVEKDKDGIHISGPMNIVYKSENGEAKILTTVSATRPASK